MKYLLEKSGYDGTGIRCYIVDNGKGRARYSEQTFSVPLWALLHPKGEGFFIYYVAHELSHLLRDKDGERGIMHDYEFYKIFMQVCPKEFQHWELKYKKSSGKYGIKAN